MNAREILAATLWSEDRGGGSEGMEPIAGVILNRVARPAWWGDDVIGVCLHQGQFSGWHWADPNFRPLLTVDETNPSYALALVIADRALAGTPVNRANGASHYFARAIGGHPPDWYWFNPQIKTGARSPCFETKHHLFFAIGPGK